MKIYKMDIEKDLLQTEVGEGALNVLVGIGDGNVKRQQKKEARKRARIRKPKGTRCKRVNGQWVCKGPTD